MGLDRYFTDTERAGHLLVQAADHNQIHDFPLPRGQCLILPFESVRMTLAVERLRAASERCFHYVEEQLRIEGFRDEVQGARPHGHYRVAYSRSCAHEDHGHAACSHKLLQLKSI